MHRWLGLVRNAVLWASDQASVYVAINAAAAPQGGGPHRTFLSHNRGATRYGAFR